MAGADGQRTGCDFFTHVDASRCIKRLIFFRMKRVLQSFRVSERSTILVYVTSDNPETFPAKIRVLRRRITDMVLICARSLES